MSYPVPANEENNNIIPDDIAFPNDDGDAGFDVQVAEMGLVRSMRVSAAVLSYISKLSPREFFMFKGALGTPDARMRY